MKANLKDIVVLGGGILAFVVGAGFASGQEILQYFTHLGFWGSLGAGLVAMIVVSWFSMTLLEDGRRLQLKDANGIFEYYLGKKLSVFLEWFVPIVMFLVASMMFSAAGAAVSEHYGLSPDVGRILMAVLTLVTVLLGLKKLVHVIGYIAPVIIIFTIYCGIASIAQNPEGLAQSGGIVKTLEIPSIYSNWFISGVMYGAFLLSGIMPYIAGIGTQAKSKKDTRLAGLFAGISFLVGTMILGTGMLANIGEVYDKEIPALAVIAKQMPIITSIFAIFLFLAIYTTAVPMLWTALNRVVSDENSAKYKVAAVVLTFIAYFGGYLKFSTMVGIVYPILGYVGLALLGVMVYTKYFKAKLKSSQELDKDLTEPL